MKVLLVLLEQCHKKISLYNEHSQEYLGGVEATRLLSNIKEALSVKHGNVCDSDCISSEDGKCIIKPVMLWTRNHKELSEVICDSYNCKT